MLRTHMYAFYPIDVFHLSFNFLCLLLLYSVSISVVRITWNLVLTEESERVILLKIWVLYNLKPWASNSEKGEVILPRNLRIQII